MNNRFKVFITKKIPRAGIELLEQKGYQVTVHPEDIPISRAELEKAVAEYDALICLLSDTIDKEILSKARKLKVIANYAVGYNNIDVQEAAKRKIFVTNTPDVLTAATADLTWALILAVSRRVVEADRFLRKGQFKGWQPELLLGMEIKGKTLGIVGAGRIGQAVARRAIGFEMNIVYHSTQSKPAFEEETNARYLSLDELVEVADIVSLHCPLTPQTVHLLNKERIFAMKKGAILINTARGPVVDEEALVAALKKGHLFGAGLDVFEHEPEVHPELLKLNNVVLLPHIGSATVETRDEMARMAARNVISVLEKNEAVNPVNFF
ncbi:2-hydroxyacid dehydrogenase [Calditrichota bacterium GD2]